VLLAALTVSGCSSADDGASEEPPPASASTTSTPADPPSPPAGGSVTELTVDPGAVTGRCAVPTPEILKGNDLAFDGVVDSIDGGLVTLRPTAVYAGEVADTVTVQAPSAELQALLAAVSFEPGGRYLVAAQDDRIALCTLSAPWTQELADTYEQAFGTPQ